MKNSKVKQKSYSFSGKVWKYKGKGGWYFITLPKNLSKEIRKNHGLDEEGWGRLKALANIGQAEWKTAIWYDSKFNAYLLPLKSLIRRLEKIEDATTMKVVLTFEDTSIHGWINRKKILKNRV